MRAARLAHMRRRRCSVIAYIVLGSTGSNLMRKSNGIHSFTRGMPVQQSGWLAPCIRTHENCRDPATWHNRVNPQPSDTSSPLRDGPALADHIRSVGALSAIAVLSGRSSATVLCQHHTFPLQDRRIKFSMEIQGLSPLGRIQPATCGASFAYCHDKTKEEKIRVPLTVALRL